MKCENCFKDIDGSFGSGRFCTRSCACSFVSKQNRVLKNKKVSNTLSKEKIEKCCEYCGIKFYVINSKKDTKYCSKSCSSSANWKNENYKQKVTLKIKACGFDSHHPYNIISSYGGIGIHDSFRTCIFRVRVSVGAQNVNL